jgi:hypothetical protein
MKKIIALLLTLPIVALADNSGPLTITSSTNTVVTGTAGASATIAANKSRQQAILTNTGTMACYVKLSGTVVNSGTYDFIVNPVASGQVNPLILGPGFTGAFVISTGTVGNATINVSQLLR